MAVFRRYTCGLLYETVGACAMASAIPQQQSHPSKNDFNNLDVLKNEPLEMLSPLLREISVLLCIIIALFVRGASRVRQKPIRHQSMKLCRDGRVHKK